MDEEDEVRLVNGVLMGAFGGVEELGFLEGGRMVTSSSFVKSMMRGFFHMGLTMILGFLLVVIEEENVMDERRLRKMRMDPSNMYEFYQKHRPTNIWTKNHPLKQVIGDPSKPVMTRRRLHTDAEMYMYALTVSTTKSTNIKEALLDHS
ncbi:hypothetical protein Tco_0792061 [Tanacetum coccineum]